MLCSTVKKDSVKPLESQTTNMLFDCCVCGSPEASRILSRCMHTVCKECVGNVHTSDKYICKKCNESSDKLLINAALCKMACPNEAPNCSWCAEGGEVNISLGRCEQCDQWLCSECIKGHNRMPPFRSHTVNIVGDSGDKGLKCETHPLESLELFCETCGVLTCRDCQLSVHRDHGGHRWVKEKAELLRPGLLNAVQTLEQWIEQLRTMAEIVENAPVLLQSSVNEAKSLQRNCFEAFLGAIKNYNKKLEEDIDKKAGEHILTLSKARSLIQRLQDRIEYTIRLTNCLFDNEEKDPASLVQLAGCLEDRLVGLTNEASSLDVYDTCGGAENKGTVSGWRDSAASRVKFVLNRSPEELAQLMSSICWTLERNSEDAMNSTAVSEMSTCSDSGEGGDMSESVAVFDGPITEQNRGCAVCRSPGLFVVCVGCERCFHPDCHLPRLDTNNGNRLSSEPWMCSFCIGPPINSRKTRPRNVRDHTSSKASQESCKWTQKQYESGCRILLSLLCQSEAVPFNSNVCPVCCSTMEDSYTFCSDPADGLCGVFHRLPDLRRRLEASTKESGQSISSWICAIDVFITDAITQLEESGVSNTVPNILGSTDSLRGILDTCVESFYPTFFET